MHVPNIDLLTDATQMFSAIHRSMRSAGAFLSEASIMIGISFNTATAATLRWACIVIQAEPSDTVPIMKLSRSPAAA